MVSRLPRGVAERRHLAQAKWLSHLAKAEWLRTRKLVYKFLRILHAVGQRPGAKGRSASAKPILAKSWPKRSHSDPFRKQGLLDSYP